MTLTVRLDPTLESALERYCTERGATKSLVVQESLAAYLLADKRPVGAASGLAADAGASANYRAFLDAGLLGAVAGNGVSATKQVVRDRVMRRLGRHGADQSQTTTDK